MFPINQGPSQKKDKNQKYKILFAFIMFLLLILMMEREFTAQQAVCLENKSEVLRLQRENDELTQELEILKESITEADEQEFAAAQKDFKEAIPEAKKLLAAFNKYYDEKGTTLFPFKTYLFRCGDDCKKGFEDFVLETFNVSVKVPRNFTVHYIDKDRMNLRYNIGRPSEYNGIDLIILPKNTGYYPDFVKDSVLCSTFQSFAKEGEKLCKSLGGKLQKGILEDTLYKLE